MLIELAIGDAYAAAFEYAPDDFVQQHHTLSGYVKHPRHAIDPGCYTDDTQMSLAIAEALVSAEPWTFEHLARRFVQAFKRDQRQGYAHSFYHFLLNVRDEHDFLSRIRPDSDKSGAAMRAAPLGVLPDHEDVLRRCHIQATLTHNTADGIDAAKAAALMTHYLLYNYGPKAELGRWIAQYVPGQWDEPWQGKVGAKGWMSVRAAITAVEQSQTLSELLTCCIAFRGDVDTVAAIAMAAGACSAEITDDLPSWLHQGLERGTYGYDYIRELDTQLLELAVPDHMGSLST